MRLSDGLQLFSLARYRRCKKIFSNPLTVHWKTTWGMNRKPFTVRFRSGGSATLPSPRDTRLMWNYFLSPRSRCLPLGMEEDWLYFHHRSNPFYLRPGTPDFRIFREVFLLDSYRLEADKTGGVVVDLGGHIGFFAAAAAPRADRVISLEPSTANRVLAIANLESAPGGDRVLLLNRALAGKSGLTQQLHISPSRPECHSLLPKMVPISPDRTTEEVETISLDDLFHDQEVDHCRLLKCDIEGAEFEVLGATSDDTMSRVDRVVVECHFSPGEKNHQKWSQLTDRLEYWGFSIEVVGDHEKILHQGGRYLVHGLRGH